jgi:polyisoprenoid-binding protein YceI
VKGLSRRPVKPEIAGSNPVDPANWRFSPQNRSPARGQLNSILSAHISGQEQTMARYAIDNTHSRVGFSLRHYVANFHGAFRKCNGLISLKKDDLAATKITVEIDAASLDTNDKKRDGHLRGQEFFNVEKYPNILFVSTEVVPKGNRRAAVRGDLTIRDVTKPVVLDAKVLGFGPDLWGGSRAGFDAHTIIKKSEFGVGWNSKTSDGRNVLGDEVGIHLSIQAVKEGK